MKPTHLLSLAAVLGSALQAQTDPGPKNGPPLAGQPLRGLASAELAMFEKGLDAFTETDDVAKGLGPRFNLDSCGGCHSHPSIGGASAPINPQVEIASKMGATNRVPPFLRPDGPTRVARFRRNPDGSPDGGVHALFTIAGRADAPSACTIAQPDFSQPGNLVFRIPTPVYGLGLVEAITDRALRANLAAGADRKRALGIGGRFNTSGNDGTITRFGWKAQNKSLLIFSGEAYNVELGVTNELFPQERAEDPTCVTTASPEDHSLNGEADTALFTAFMRYLAPPRLAPPGPDEGDSIRRGMELFDQTGCAACHTPALRTGKSPLPALSEQDVHAFSDYAIHRMGQALNDGVNQGDARGDDWRTAPLWGLSQRIFLLHDGRTKDLVEAIRLHDSPGSEAHTVVRNFEALTPEQRQDLLRFLRTL